MAQPQFRTCPACGTRNKPAWEFCVRCGESVAEVALATDVPAATAAAGAAPAAGGGVGPVVLMAVVALGVAAWAATRIQIPRDEISSTAFTAATMPPADKATAASEALSELDEGLRLLRSGKPDSALGKLEEAALGDPNDAAAQYAYAQALWVTGNRERALTFYVAAARLEAEDVQYLSDAARVCTAMNRRAEAIGFYRALLDVQPETPAALRSLSQLLMESGGGAEAVDLLRQAVTLEPDSVVLGTDLGYALERLGREPEAAEAYRRVIGVDSTADVARARLVDLEFKAGRSEQAMALVQDAIRAHPDQPGPHRSLATLLERMGKPAEAAAAYREYARLAPNASDAKALEQRAAALEGAPAPAPTGTSS